eukprot:CAMPEP_0117686976 /NCGR_PEP_ID=MMETSP0804-20121206/22825_1 /TAXON_ID=1074897 /ORGANISM="Tetraselmis astigmatica, Strain CCMP880" /LENGTH=120 /DNA_ID=CAMNT_0005498881 /DNA_START=206 /DNA_END=565 /DNA_ORIENTATION=-
MSFAVEEGYDTEEEFERELAALDSTFLDKDSDYDNASLQIGAESGDSDADDGVSVSDAGGDDRAALQSLAAFRKRLEERDNMLDDFTVSLNRIWDGIPATSDDTRPVLAEKLVPGSSQAA